MQLTSSVLIAGYHHYITRYGQIGCWGSNPYYGQLGLVNIDDYLSPPEKAVSLPTGFEPIQVIAGRDHSGALSDDDNRGDDDQEIKCWERYGHEDSIARGDSNLSILDLGKNENGDYLEIVRFDSAVLQTVNPTTDPTADPTNDPTTEPTPSPTALCESIYIQIENFEEFTSSVLNDIESLQIKMANLTQSAIAQHVDPAYHQMDGDSFYVEFKHSSGSLFVVQSLCTFTGSNMLILTNIVIEDNTESINEAIEDGIIDSFMNGESDGSLTASISLTEFQNTNKTQLAESSSDIIHGIVMVVATVMVCFNLSLFVLYLLYRNRINIVDAKQLNHVPSARPTMHSIYLGQNIPGQGEVTQTRWTTFLKSEVVTRLEYATITEGVGIYKGETEKVFIVSVVTNQPEIIQSLREVGDVYKSQFEQETVMYTATPVPEVIFT